MPKRNQLVLILRNFLLRLLGSLNLSQAFLNSLPGNGHKKSRKSGNCRNGVFGFDVSATFAGIPDKSRKLVYFSDFCSMQVFGKFLVSFYDFDEFWWATRIQICHVLLEKSWRLINWISNQNQISISWKIKSFLSLLNSRSLYQIEKRNTFWLALAAALDNGNQIEQKIITNMYLIVALIQLNCYTTFFSSLSNAMWSFCSHLILIQYILRLRNTNNQHSECNHIPTFVIHRFKMQIQQDIRKKLHLHHSNENENILQ